MQTSSSSILLIRYINLITLPFLSIQVKALEVALAVVVIAIFGYFEKSPRSPSDLLFFTSEFG